jgi:O-antigen ligase
MNEINKITIESKKLKLNVFLGVFFIGFGLFLINFSLLDDTLRRNSAFACFGISFMFSIKEILFDLIVRKNYLNYFIGIFVLIYVILVYQFLGAYGEYGLNKFYYLLLIVFLSFISFPSFFRSIRSLEILSKMLFYASLIYCFFAIILSGTGGSGGRTGELGLNPAVLARICMVAGLYIICEIYFKGLNTMRLLILLFSCTAVFFTGTKTPVPVLFISYFFLTTKRFNVKTVFKIISQIVLFLILAFLVLKYIVPENFSERILNPEAFSSKEQFKEGNRFDLYTLSIDVIKNNLLGTGFGGFALFHRFIIAPHNIIFEIAVEMGFIMVFLFLIWMTRIIRIIRKIENNDITTMFFSMLFIYMIISFMFGGEITIQALLLYLTGSIFFNYKKLNIFNLKT